LADRLTLRQLDVLRLMLETGSTTETGRLLRISQPAVSKLLQQMQNQFDLRLFTREHGRLVPTQEARILAPELIHALAAVNGVLRRMGDLQGTTGGLLTIAATPTLANTLVPQAMARFLVQHETVEIRVNTALNQEVIDSVADHRADIGLVLMPANDAATLARNLTAANLVCVMPSGHSLGVLAEVTPRDLAGVRLISYSARQPIGALIDVAFEAAGLRRVVAVEVTQSWTGCALAAAGGGVAVVDGYALLGRAFPDLLVRPFRPRVSIIARLLHAQHRPLSRIAADFVTNLRDVIRDHIAAGTLCEA
jgi:DNA-binding transcriptional LysR family regulator